jgi:hypothetical protein
VSGENKMIEQKLTSIDIPYAEFEVWANKQAWICVHQREQDFGDKTSSHHIADTTLIKQTYTYLTPAGMRIDVLVENHNVKSVSVSPNSPSNV